MRHALFKTCIAAIAVVALVVPAQGEAGFKVRDAGGNEVGELAGSWSPHAPDPGHWYFKYRLARADAVWLYARKNRLETLTGPGDNRALFTTADCSGKDMFVTISWPPRALSRRAMVLPGGPADRAPNAWLWSRPHGRRASCRRPARSSAPNGLKAADVRPTLRRATPSRDRPAAFGCIPSRICT